MRGPFPDRGAALDSACRQARRTARGEAAFSGWPGMGWRRGVGLCAGGGGFVVGGFEKRYGVDWRPSLNIGEMRF